MSVYVRKAKCQKGTDERSGRVREAPSGAGKQSASGQSAGCPSSANSITLSHVEWRTVFLVTLYLTSVF